MTERLPPYTWQPNNMLERSHQMMSILGSIPWDVSVFPAANVEHQLLPHFQGLRHIPYHRCCCCRGTADVCLFSQTSPHVGHISPCLSNVLLIYTCWAQGCIGRRCTLTASITQRALLLPFKIHLKRPAGATVRPGHGCNDTDVLL